MKLKDTGLTFQDIKDKVNKYMIETYERFDFLAETADGMYIYDENGTPYLDFYAGIAVNSAGNCNPKVVAAVKDQVFKFETDQDHIYRNEGGEKACCTCFFLDYHGKQ